ncbi:hypothetical protein H8R03_29630 [Streptomyces sp. JH010]|uniref:hypothetical protein n=1 Tax=Streptomyces sp. JH010 TaxID=2763535 RepID=UPI0023F6198C|nr:hypothetical protein [Streptomyces sp. JH010]MDF6066089.1 hypothetical protein [Streptomyces sp. JH010]
MTPEDVASFERTLELGKEVAAGLAEHDVLGRWMAHHIGDLIIRAETTPAADTDAIRRETATAVLALWNQRATLPMPNPPLNAFEPVFKALERLSEPQDPWGFYRMFPRGHEPDQDDMVAVPLLRNALVLEDAVHRLVREIVVLAAREAADKEAKWLKLSEHLEEDEQRAARDAVLELARTLAMYTGDAVAEPVVEAGHSKLITTLLHAEAQLAEVRRVLEARRSRTSADGEPGAPA